MISAPFPLWAELADAFVNGWSGRPFRWDGRDEAGVDCWGLVWRWHADVLGIDLPDWTKGAQNRAWIRRTLAEERAGPRWRALAEPEPGCMVLAIPAARPAHVGIFWRGRIFHAEELRGVVLERLPDFVRCHPNHEFGYYRP